MTVHIASDDYRWERVSKRIKGRPCGSDGFYDYILQRAWVDGDGNREWLDIPVEAAEYSGIDNAEADVALPSNDPNADVQDQDRR